MWSSCLAVITLTLLAVVGVYSSRGGEGLGEPSCAGLVIVVVVVVVMMIVVVVRS